MRHHKLTDGVSRRSGDLRKRPCRCPPAVRDLTAGRFAAHFYLPTPEAPTVRIPRRPAVSRVFTGGSRRLKGWSLWAAGPEARPHTSERCRRRRRRGPGPVRGFV